MWVYLFLNAIGYFVVSRRHLLFFGIVYNRSKPIIMTINLTSIKQSHLLMGEKTYELMYTARKTRSSTLHNKSIGIDRLRLRYSHIPLQLLKNASRALLYKWPRHQTHSRRIKMEELKTNKRYVRTIKGHMALGITLHNNHIITISWKYVAVHKQKEVLVFRNCLERYVAH